MESLWLRRARSRAVDRDGGPDGRDQGGAMKRLRRAGQRSLAIAELLPALGFLALPQASVSAAARRWRLRRGPRHPPARADSMVSLTAGERAVP
jgi:hypothetical protein